MKKLLVFMGIFALILPVMFLGCEGDDGAAGAPGTSTGTISGTVTNGATDSGLEGVTVDTDPDQGSTTTAADGSYTLSSLPAGNYTVTFNRGGTPPPTGYKAQFETVTSSVSVLAAVTSTEDAELDPTVPVLVEVDTTGTATPGSTLAATVTTTPLDGSTVTGVVWSQKNSVTVTFDNTTATTTNVTLPGLAAYKDELFKVLAEPPGGGVLPPGVPLPPVDEAEYSGGLQDRFGVQGLDPLSLEEAGLVTLVATVTTTSGTYTEELEVHTELPWKQATGIQNVPINVPVLLHGGTRGGTQTTWDWSVTGPATVTLDDATAQNPSFTPTASGVYTVSESVSVTSFKVGAGTWAGAIDGQDANGRPITTSSCAITCHSTLAPEVNTIFGQWKETGHAEIFSSNMDNPAGHWSLSCAPCHTVGYDTDADNDGFDEAVALDGWVAPHAPDDPPGPGTWDGILADFPNTARLANIQCENCHGPSNPFAVGLHGNTIVDPERFSISSLVCGSCHGEPGRHGRYQQWQLSLHANYERAINYAVRDDCSRCHTGNGFLAWGELYDWAGGQNLALADITWDNNTVHPQTCVTCHDPHDIGTTTGEPTNANVRIEDDTPVLDAGWQAFGVGRGAICMVCHNHRRGLTNDDWSLGVQGVAMERSREPHHGPQADILMGQSAFFVNVGIPGAHARVTDTCVRCHMEKTPPPALLSYNLGGTNHTFFAAPNICGECHDTIEDSAAIKSGTESQQQNIASLMGPAIGQQLTAIINSGDNVVSGEFTLTAASLPVTVSDYSAGVFTVTTVDNTYTGVELDDMRLNSSSGDRIALASEEMQIITKANWNVVLVEDDKSGGVHNPRFIGEVLAATYNRLLNNDFTALSPIIKPLP